MTRNVFIQLKCRSGSLAGQLYSYIEPELAPLPAPLRFGRHPDAHIRPLGDEESMVSRNHAELQYKDSRLSLLDVGSTHGVYVAGSRDRVEQLDLGLGEGRDFRLGVNGPIFHLSLGAAIPFGPYLLVGKLGEGGMGEVYVGWDSRLGRLVALKLLRKSVLAELEDAERMLLNEARIVSQLEHPNIVRIYEIGEEAGHLFIAMEYIRGLTLNQIVKQLGARGQKLGPALAAGILRQACLGLHAAHQLPIQVVHRDVSPNNIMIMPESVKVIDFGVAQAKNRVGASFTEGGKMTGCPPYMSPEQIRTPQNIDRRSDLFSVGVALYELCTGSSPFRKETTAATLLAVMTQEAPPLRSLCPEASPALAELAARLLCKDREGRPSTAAELAAALREAASPSFLDHDNIVGALRELGLDLNGSVLRPLKDEPSVPRSAQLRPALPPPADKQRLTPNRRSSSAIALEGRPTAPMPAGLAPERPPPPPPPPPPARQSTAASPGSLAKLVLAELPDPAELVGPQGQRIQVRSLHLGGHGVREPMVLPLDLEGLLPGVSHPLMLRLSGSLLELCIAPQVLSMSRAVRIYAAANSTTARATYALPADTTEQPLFVGHHRGPLHEVHVSSRSLRPASEPALQLALAQLALTVVAPASAQRLLLLWRVSAPTSTVFITCVTAESD
jgi:serine/threonine protein kinase